MLGKDKGKVVPANYMKAYRDNRNISAFINLAT